MEQVLEKEQAQDENMDKGKIEKKEFKICGISIWRILAYFIIYSIVGWAIETAFGMLTKGVIESRKSFLYGPFCGIYGIGAVVMILGLQRFNKNNYSLFFGGFLIGSIVEYVISWIGEMIFHVVWWDYSDMAFNINGRICIIFSFFWGILAIYLMSYFNPKMDKLIDKFSPRFLKIFSILGVTILLIDCLITGFALKMFYTRLIDNYNVQISNAQEYADECRELYEIPEVKNFVDKYWNDEKMLKTFPNLKLTDADGNIIFIKDILSDIQPYYVRLFTPRR